MSRPSLPFDLPLDHLHVTRWSDPLVDSFGHEVRSSYVEQFWLAVLGPSTTLLARHLSAQLDDHPDGFDLHLEDTAKALGLGLRGGVNGPFLRALARTSQFGLTRAAGPGAIAARQRVQTLTYQQTLRLPAHLRDEHAAWLAKAQATPEPHERRQRARRLALSLLELGESLEATEHQLHRWKVHPAMAHEAIRWARARQGELAITAADQGDPLGQDLASALPIPPPTATRTARQSFAPTDDAA